MIVPNRHTAGLADPGLALLGNDILALGAEMILPEGIEHDAARLPAAVSLDGDGQNDPADIPKLVAMQENADLVCGWRVNRKDPLAKKIISKLSNLIRSRLCADGIHDTGCSLKLYRKSCLQKIKLYNGMHRFLPALFKLEDFRILEVPVNHRERTKGTSNYNIFNRSLGPILDMFAVRWMRRRKLHYTVIKELGPELTKRNQVHQS